MKVTDFINVLNDARHITECLECKISNSECYEIRIDKCMAHALLEHMKKMIEIYENVEVDEMHLLH